MKPSTGDVINRISAVKLLKSYAKNWTVVPLSVYIFWDIRATILISYVVQDPWHLAAIKGIIWRLDLLGSIRGVQLVLGRRVFRVSVVVIVSGRRGEKKFKSDRQSRAASFRNFCQKSSSTTQRCCYGWRWCYFKRACRFVIRNWLRGNAGRWRWRCPKWGGGLKARNLLSGCRSFNPRWRSYLVS